MRPVRVERERNGYRVFDAYGFGLTISDIGRDTCEEIAAAINAYYPPLRVPFEPFDLGDVHNDHLQICGEINKLWRAINELGDK